MQLFSTVALLAKGTEILAHKITLLRAENRTLRQANEALSKRWRAKKTRIREGGALRIEDTRDIIARREAEEQVRRDKRSREGNQSEGQSTARHYSTCSKTGHNAQTCKKNINILSSIDSEESK